MDVPEVTMKRQTWKMDVPETWMEDKEMWVKEPISVCEDKKIGQKPETTCVDTWVEAFGVKTKGVPNCTVRWTDIITTICWPETRDKKIFMSVPQFRMTTHEFSVDVPEVTKKTRDFSLHLPRFEPDAGCVGGQDCAEMCRSELEDQTNKQADARNAKLAPIKERVRSSTSQLFQCHLGNVDAQATEIASFYDKYLTVAEATLKALLEQGLTDAAKTQEGAIVDLREKRKQSLDELEKTRTQLMESEKSAVSNLN